MNKGIGDYIVLVLLGAIMGFKEYGFEWYGLKVLLFVNLVVCLYSLIVCLIEIIVEKFDNK